MSYKTQTEAKPINRMVKPSVAHTLLEQYQVTEGEGCQGRGGDARGGGLMPGEERHAHAPGSTQQQHHPMEAKTVPEGMRIEKASDREFYRAIVEVYVVKLSLCYPLSPHHHHHTLLYLKTVS